jgi:hypothetical protein
MIWRLVLSTVASFGWIASAAAHRPSEAYLTLHVDGSAITGQWEIALRDLELLAPVDRDEDRQLTWGELQNERPRLEAALLDALSFEADGGVCPLRIDGLRLNDRLDGRFAWFDLAGSCPSGPEALSLGYRLLFDLDPSHRGILVLTARGASHLAVLGPSGPHRIDLRTDSKVASFGQYLREGVHHIWIGYDHVLFLLALLIPAVLVRRQGRWEPEVRVTSALWRIAGVVTAFTLAHSVTLALVAFDVLRLPSALVESAIALSVLFAAMNNIWPIVTRRQWAVAFGFGLVHGFGFASVFGELGLPEDLRLLGLLAFNLGVELGQLSIVLVVVPMLYAMRETRFYQTGIRVAGSGVVMLVAAFWLTQRIGLWQG